VIGDVLALLSGCLVGVVALSCMLVVGASPGEMVIAGVLVAACALNSVVAICRRLGRGARQLYDADW
jgi:hypothetical protein